MSLLTDRLPDTVEICGEAVPIRSDFRTWIQFERLWLDSNISNRQKLSKSLQLVFPDRQKLQFSDPQAIVDRMIWFYRCGDRQLNTYQRRSAQKRSSESYKHTERPYDYDYDDRLIVAAFMQQYGIDLTSLSIHWWRFRALLEGLTESTLFVQAMGYRSMKLSSKLPTEQRQRYEQLKAIYALPRPASEEQMEAAMSAAVNAGDTAELMNLLLKEHKNGT